MVATPDTFADLLAHVAPDSERYGYVNLQRQWVVPPILQSAYDFSEGYCPVYIEPGVGLLDGKGEYLIHPADVPYKLICFIDTQGQPTLGGKLFKWARPFSEGLAAVAPTREPLTVDTLPFAKETEDFSERCGFSPDRWGYIDKSGEFVIEPQFYLCESFSNGVAPIMQRIPSSYRSPVWGSLKNQNWGYIDRSGAVIVEPQFSHANDFKGNMARVDNYSELDDDGNRLSEDFSNLINRSGRLLLPMLKPGDIYGRFWGELAIVKINDKWGAINSEGEFVVEPKYDGLWGDSEGYGAYRLEDKNGYIRSDGVEVCSLPFKRFGFFCEGLALAFHPEQGKYGYIDEDFRFVIEPQFDGAEDFSEGLAAVYPNGKCGVGKCGYINRQGKLVIPCNYFPGDRFHEGAARAVIRVGGKEHEGHINQSGEWITPPEYMLVGDFSNGVASVQLGKKLSVR